MSQSTHFDTLQVHAGNSCDPTTGACATPIYQTASYGFESIEQAARLFELKDTGYIYTRLSNPTVHALEERITALEGGSAAVATSSGQAATFLALQNIATQGDNIVASSSLYGGSLTLFGNTFKSFGITFRFCKGRQPADYAALIDSRTKALYVETIGNADFYVPDFEPLAALAAKAGIPLIIDNTFGGGGYLFQPFSIGAAVVVHSATKWIGGHGNSIAGLVVDGGNFDWGNGKFPGLSQPCDSYHGLCFWDQFGPKAFAERARALGLRDLGCCMSPFNAFLLLQGVETLSLRMQRAMDNAQELAQWLQARQEVASVNYPGLPGNPYYANARKYFKNGAGAVLSFCVKGTKEQTARFVEKLDLITHLANVGDNKTLIVHPASTTHGQLDNAALRAAGLEAGTLRLAVGIEYVEDIKQDLAQALRVLSL